MPQTLAPTDLPIPSVNDVIDDYISRHHRAVKDLLERGRFGHPGEGATGPLTPGVTLCSEGIEVETPTQEQWDALIAWHNYCRTYGYRHNTLPDTAPPPPVRPSWRDIPRVLVKWKAIQDRYAQAACGQDMLF